MPLETSKHDWRGIVAAILAVSVGVVLVTAEVGRNISQTEADLIAAILGTIVGALAGFVGGAYVGNKRNGNNSDTGTGSGTGTSDGDGSGQ